MPDASERLPRTASQLVVAGVGASAGGLKAFSQLLAALPPRPGLAIVLVQHLAPQHESALATLLGARTSLPVVQAVEGMRLEADKVFVIPPNVQMGVRDGGLHLTPRPSDRSQYTPIDVFLRSLAEYCQERAIAVILSGTASDGAVGVREVKAAGGIAIAQDPESADYDGMPRAAIAAGVVDLVLRPADIGRELVRLAAHPLRVTSAPPSREGAEQTAPFAPPDEHLDEVFTLLRSATGVDFRRYKRPTIHRRLHRRMVLQRMAGIAQYVRLLRENAGEVRALYQDILIHVTRFFRDPESFATLASDVLPRIVEAHREEQPIRIWVPGCATGEEAYSIAIVAFELLGDRPGRIPVQIFATDVSEVAIQHARVGLYAETIAADVSPARLRRFFVRVDGSYKITRAVRDLCIFARQDLTRDPPFSNLDLILCRNVLIYLSVDLQRKLMTVFHYALRPDGFLALGTAETVGSNADIFAAVDKKHRIYRKKPGRLRERHELSIEQRHADPPHAVRPSTPSRGRAGSVQADANRLIEERYAPPGVIVDGSLQVVQFRGQTGAFLAPAPGEPSTNVLKMAREGMLHGLRSALLEARRTKDAVRRRRIRYRANGGWRHVDVEVLPLVGADREHFLILFDEPASRGGKSAGLRLAGEPAGRREKGRLATLQQELASSREYLQSIIQELEAANEELQSANEEVLSANEELQSTNEELDTAKEELQSTNEELNTVNEELHARNDELTGLNSDLVNLLASVQIAIVIVGGDLRIRRFTPMAERVLNLMPSDVGRPIGHIKPNIDCPDLEELIAQVVDTVTPMERTVEDRQGHEFSLRVRPYKNVLNRIDGAVLALFDLHAPAEPLRIPEVAGAIAHATRAAIAICDTTLRIRAANRAFCDAFAADPAALDGKPLAEIGDGVWSTPPIREALESVVRDGRPADGLTLGGDGAEPFRANVRRAGAPDGGDAVIVVSLEPGRGPG